MKRLALIALIATLAVGSIGGCSAADTRSTEAPLSNQEGQGAQAYENGQPVEAPTDTGSKELDEANRAINEADSVEEAVEAQCQALEDNGSFDDGLVSREEVGC